MKPILKSMGWRLRGLKKPLLYTLVWGFWSTKLRSFLAMLGVLIGTASVVALVGITELATDHALAQFRTLGTHLLSVSFFIKEGRFGAEARHLPALWHRVGSMDQSIQQLAPYAVVWKPVVFDGHVLPASVVVADETLQSLLHLKMRLGHFISPVYGTMRYAVIGDAVYQAMQRAQPAMSSPLGQLIQVGPWVFQVIGVLKPWPVNVFMHEDLNRSVMLPIKSTLGLGSDIILNQSVIRLQPGADFHEVLASIERQAHQVSSKWQVHGQNSEQLIASMESQSRIFSVLLGIIGGIALCVGGIGIMNVMWVSVMERQQEIGIRKAIGATQRAIQILFLSEALVLSGLGGFIGVFLGLMVTKGVVYFYGWAFVWHFKASLIGLLVSMMTGLFFGWYPARSAAKSDPIVSLTAL